MLALVRWCSRGLSGVAGVAVLQDRTFEGVDIAAPYETALTVTFALGLVVTVLTSEPVLKRMARGPNLEAGDLEQETRYVNGRNLQVVLAPIWNARDSGGEQATAGDVVPKLEAFRDDALFTSTRGSWDFDHAGKHPATVTFRPTHDSHRLELVAKFAQADNAFLAGQREARLVPGEYVVRASLRGDRLRKPAVFEWRFRNPGKGGQLAILTPDGSTPPPEEQIVTAPAAATSASIASSSTTVVVGSPAPEIEVEIPYAWYFDNEEDGKRYLAFPLNVVNRERSRHVSLHFEFVFAMVFRLGHREETTAETRLHADLRDRRNALPDPLRVAPESEAKGTHYSHWYLTTGLTFGAAVDGIGDVSPTREEDRLFVRVTDRISNTTFEVPIPGVGTPSGSQDA